MIINEWIVINDRLRQGSRVNAESALGMLSAEDMYSALQCSYPKFFKMDKLCKWAWVATEYLLGGKDEAYKGIDKNKIAICLTTGHGCIDVDKRYLDGIAIASPGLFVLRCPTLCLGSFASGTALRGNSSVW